MKESGEGYVRADQIDLKRIDEQLERFTRAATMEKSRRAEGKEAEEASGNGKSLVASLSLPKQTRKKERQEWEIDPAKLLIKSVIARGTFGTVHRGVYDGQDVAGESTASPFNFLPA